MSIRDDFLKDADAAQRLRRQLELDFADRLKLIEAQESSIRLDARIRGSLQQMAVEVDSLLRTIKQYERQPERYKLSTKEFDRRSKLASDLESALTAYDRQFNSSYEPPATQPVLSFKRTSGVESQDTHNLTPQQLYEAKKDMIRQHGKVEEALQGTSENLVVAVRNIGDEVDLHNEMLGKVADNAEAKQMSLGRANYRMKKLIYESSDCCMAITIVVLVASLLIFLFLL